MLNAAAFFTFVHTFGPSSTPLDFAVAYKPPGPMLKGAGEELVRELLCGPVTPDGIVLLVIQEEEEARAADDDAVQLSELAQARIVGRVPLLRARLSLRRGTVETSLISGRRSSVTASIQHELVKNLAAWMTSGMAYVFRPEKVLLIAPPGYSYQKPSGSRERFFLRPDFALSSSAAVAFVALAAFSRIFAGRLERARDLRSVFVDTMAIAPVAYALRDLLDLCRPRLAFLIESFHSYGGMEKIKRPLPGTSFCLISASASMSLQKRWIAEKQVASFEVLTLLSTVLPADDGALLCIDRPKDIESIGPCQLSIRLAGETFLPEQEVPKKVLLRETVHGCAQELRHLAAFAGRGVFDAFRAPTGGGQRARALAVDGDALVRQPEFQEWLYLQVVNRAKAATRVVVYQDDQASKALSHQVQLLLELVSQVDAVRVVPATSLESAGIQQEDAVIVCAAAVGKGSQLLDISRRLRDLHDGPRLYVVGFQVAETREELRTLPQNLRHSKTGVPHDYAAYGAVAIGSQLALSMEREVDEFFAQSYDLESVSIPLARRGEVLLGGFPVGAMALLPARQGLAGRLFLRPGFAYWPRPGYESDCQAEVLATIGVILQRAREEVGVEDEHRLSSSTFRHVMLHPENFSRFNDGVLQAALLRNAYPSELDYRADHAASDFMKSLILRGLARSGEESGEATLEFLLALALRRLQLTQVHLDEVINEALADRGRDAEMQKAINFLLKPFNGVYTVPRKLPF